MKRRNFFSKTITYLLAVDMSIGLLEGCQNNINKKSSRRCYAKDEEKFYT